MRPKNINKNLSACCKAKTKIEGTPDFIGSNEICTISYSCTKCGKSCDLYVSPKEQSKIDRENLKEKLECILDNLLARFLPRPNPRFEKYVKGILDDRDKAIKEIIDIINEKSILKIYPFPKIINPLNIKLGENKLVKHSSFCYLTFKSKECGYTGKKYVFCNKTKRACRIRGQLESFEKYVWNGEKIKG